MQQFAHLLINFTHLVGVEVCWGLMIFTDCHITFDDAYPTSTDGEGKILNFILSGSYCHKGLVL